MQGFSVYFNQHHSPSNNLSTPSYKTTKLDFLPLPHWFLLEIYYIRIEKQIHAFHMSLSQETIQDH